jgi:hypothetical protein
MGWQNKISLPFVISFTWIRFKSHVKIQYEIFGGWGMYFPVFGYFVYYFKALSEV